jgi:hypothetical protein
VLQKAVTYPNVARCVSKARTSVGKRATARSQAGLRALQLRDDLNEDFIYVHPFETKKLDFLTIFTYSFSKPYL